VDTVGRAYQALPMVSTIDILLGREGGQAGQSYIQSSLEIM
jgi:hypothetical protein